MLTELVAGMQLPIDETKLHHPFDRHVIAIFALLNLLLLALALFVVFQGADWLAAHPILAKYAPKIRGFLVAALLALPAISLLRNARHANIEGNSIRISSGQLSMLDSILRSHCERLGIERGPELFFSDNVIKEPARAYTSWEREFIVLNAKFLQPNLEEMRDIYEFFLGRELDVCA